MTRGVPRRLLVPAVLVGLVLAGCSGDADRPAPTAAASVPCRAGDVDALDHSDPRLGEPSFTEEFDGTSVDRDRWTVRDETTLSFDQARIMARNVSVADGLLSIRAERGPAKGRPVTTGYLDTIGHFSQRLGRWEVRARLPVEPGASRGLWPAFWLRADDRSGEVDVVEAWGTPAARSEGRDLEREYAWTVHEDTRSAPGSDRVGGWGTPPGDAALADGFHVFAVDRSPTCLRFSVDGRTTGVVDLRRERGVAAALDDELNIRLNLQVGGSYWGRLDPSRPGTTRLPATFVVDHVRAWSPRR